MIFLSAVRSTYTSVNVAAQTAYTSVNVAAQTALPALRSVYTAVNVAGRYNKRHNSFWTMERGFVAWHDARVDRSLRYDRIGGTAPGTLQAVRFAVGNQLQQFRATVLAHRAGIALIRHRELPVVLSAFAGAHYLFGGAALAPFFVAPALANFVLGHGNNADFYGLWDNISARVPLPLARWHAHIDHVAQYGLLGAVAEGVPEVAADSLDSRGHAALAAVCMVGAVLGRVTLQPIRLIAAMAICTVESLRAGLWVVACTAVYYGLHGSFVLARGATQLAGREESNFASALQRGSIGARHAFEWIMREADSIALSTTLEDSLASGADNVTDKIRRYASKLLAEFQQSETEPDHSAVRLQRIAAHVAEELRHYCRDLPNDQALRFGLGLVKGFLAATYDEDLCRFAPPELGAATS